MRDCRSWPRLAKGESPAAGAVPIWVPGVRELEANPVTSHACASTKAGLCGARSMRPRIRARSETAQSRALGVG
jgi:hypothetical protein